MTQKRLAQAYKAISELTKERWLIKDAYALHKLKKQLQSAWDFQLERETFLIKSYGGEAVDGAWKFPSVEAKENFEKEMTELNTMESDIEIEPVTLKAPEGMTIAPDTLDTLDGIVEFTEG